MVKIWQSLGESEKKFVVEKLELNFDTKLLMNVQDMKIRKRVGTAQKNGQRIKDGLGVFKKRAIKGPSPNDCP